MNSQPNGRVPKAPEPPRPLKDFQTFYFSQLLKRPVCAGKIRDRIGNLSDLVFRLSEPYPEAIGIFLDHGWGKPSEFVPWDKVVKVDEDAVFVTPAEGGGPYPPFVDQPGWLLVDQHLMGQTILDMDGRRTEVVNDVHLLESKGRMLIVHVDVSFNGFWRRWGLRWMQWTRDRLISWKYVQPLSVEDTATDTVSLSITRKQIRELPSEDLATILEELSGGEQQAVFSALDSGKAAEALVRAEPRAQRQLIARLRRERARTILSEMSVPQLADLFSVLPHDDMMEMMSLLPPEQAARIRPILTEREATARALMSTAYLAMGKDATVGHVLGILRSSGREYHGISYIYVVSGPEKALLGVADLRQVVLSPEHLTLADIMAAPVVAAEEDDTRSDLEDLFARYHYRMIPVVDAQDHLVGIIHHNDIMKGISSYSRT
jgi:CBS domain-containing protein/uncharacterized protein YrrD